MKRGGSWRKKIRSGGWLLAGAALAFQAQASQEIALTIGNAQVVTMAAMERVAIGNSEIADVRQISDRELLINGKAVGTTSLIVWDTAGRKNLQTVVVTAGKAAQTMIQVDVQVMEINHSQGLAAGLDWERLIGTSGQLKLSETTAPLQAVGVLERGKLDLLVRLLAEKGSGKILAKPNLMTLSGSRAGFSSGGEVPFSTVNDRGQMQVEWKKYGVNLDVLPTAVPTGSVNVELKAEVSEVDFTHLVQGNPSIKTRWASATIYVRPGSTVVIGGLLQEKNQVSQKGLPVLGDIPVLGYLFQSTQTIKEESELVIFVTPHVIGG